jgi:DNA-binding protein H-NS
MNAEVSLEQLLEKKSELDARIAQIQADEKAAVIKTILDAMNLHGLTVRDLGGAKKTRKLGAVAAKYRDPVSGATWSGRGRRPKWFDGSEDQRIAA